MQCNKNQQDGLFYFQFVGLLTSTCFE